MTWADVLFNQMAGGDIYGAVIASYTNVMGGFFYMFLFGLALAMIYFKTRNFGNVCVIGILISPVIAAFIPSIAAYSITMLLTLSMALILYRLFR